MLIVCSFLVAVGLAQTAIAQTATQGSVRLAIFAEKTFPAYGFSTSVTPQLIARDLRAAGFRVDLLDTDSLTQPAQFNAKRYSALILPYGNNYPQEAFAAMRRFHQAGGSLVTTGIPFTHPMTRIGARDWTAQPRWGNSVRRIAGMRSTTPETALQITGDPDRRVGVSSSHFALHSGDTAVVSAQVRAPASPNGRGASDSLPGQQDSLLLLFFDANGTQIRQEVAALPATTEAAETVTVRAVAPPRTVTAAVSVTVQSAGKIYRVSHFAATINGHRVSLPNADLSQRDPEAWNDEGHTNEAARWSSNGMGIGGFAGPEPTVSISLSPDDPWHLTGILPVTTNPHPAPQWIDGRSLPAGVKILPAIGDTKRPLAALIVHRGDAFAGAVDVWTLRGYTPDRDDWETRQIIARGTIAALAHRGLLRHAQQMVAMRRLDAQPRPAWYKNLALPVVARNYPTLQPKMPTPARHLRVVDVRRLSPDERLLLISLQGIVNRTKPRVYLVFDDDDLLWLREMQKQHVTDAPITVPNPFSLLTTFRRDYKGAVVCDPKIYDSPCVAVALAGTRNLLIAKTPELAARLHLPVQIDLRNKFKDNAAALRYVRTHIFPRLDPYLTCSLDPARYDKGGLDQIIAARGSAFWVTGPKAQDFPGANQEAETKEVHRLLAKMPLGAVVRGFWWDGDGMGLDEEAGVALGSRFGKVTIVSDLITNVSVHSGVKAEKLTQKPRLPAPTLNKSKVYLSFTMSDGDNLCTWRGYFRRYFEDPARGSVPVGWGMGPSIIDLAPVWATWYYNAATPNDEFICDVSGAAYLYPPDWGMNLNNRPQALRYFYDLTATYMQRMDMRTLRLMNTNTASIAQVGALLPQVRFLMPDYGHAGGEGYSDLTYTLPTGQSVFRAVTSGSGPENLAAQIRKRAGVARPAFVNAFIWNWGSSLSDLKKTVELLGPDYVAVLPSQLDTLYRDAQKKP